MRINLGKINQLIRDAWRRGQRDSLRGASKSFCREMSFQVAREYFPDISHEDVVRIAEGRASLSWNANEREIFVLRTDEEHE